VIGLELAGGEVGNPLEDDAATTAAESIMAIGALGVPLADFLTTVIRQGIQNAQGIVSRGLGGKVKPLADELLAEYTDKLTPKIPARSIRNSIAFSWNPRGRSEN